MSVPPTGMLSWYSMARRSFCLRPHRELGDLVQEDGPGPGGPEDAALGLAGRTRSRTVPLPGARPAAWRSSPPGTFRPCGGRRREWRGRRVPCRCRSRRRGGRSSGWGDLADRGQEFLERFAGADDLVELLRLGEFAAEGLVFEVEVAVLEDAASSLLLRSS